MKRGLKAFFILLPVIISILACASLRPVYVYKYDGDWDYSATITLTPTPYGDGYDINYEGDESWVSSRQLSVKEDYFGYVKTIDGEDYYSVGLPYPFNRDYWIWSSDKKTLTYLYNGATFTLQ